MPAAPQAGLPPAEILATAKKTNPPASGTDIPIDFPTSKNPKFMVPGLHFLILLTTCAIMLLVVMFFMPDNTLKKVPVTSDQSLPVKLKEIDFKKYQLDEPEIVQYNLSELQSMTTEEKSVTYATFTKRWTEATNDLEKFDAYQNLYSNLRAVHNRTADPMLVKNMRNIQIFMSTVPEWKIYYEAAVKGKYFID